VIIAPIAKEFDVPVPEVAAVLTITLWMRLLGATVSGWLADRIGRRTPLMQPEFPAEQFHAPLRLNNATRLSGKEWLWSAKRA
jgi:MFS family permease